jgi:predicted transcriptional regulator
MNSKIEKQAAALAALSAVDRARLERFDIEADKYFKSNQGIDNAEVMREIKELISVHGKRKIDMDAKSKQAKALGALPAVERVRLDRLAARASVSPEAMWEDVWRYGFDDMEESVETNLTADAEIAAGRTVSNEEVMEGLKRIVDSHASRKQRPG